MVRPGRPERNRAAQSLRQLRRFYHVINSDEVFGTHNLGARVGITSVLHTWGSALTHHPHVHMIIPGGGISPDGERWVSCRPGFFLPVRVLSRLFRRLFLEKLIAAHAAGRLSFFGDHAPLAACKAFTAYVSRLRKIEWVVYSKPPFGGPQAV